MKVARTVVIGILLCSCKRAPAPPPPAPAVAPSPPVVQETRETIEYAFRLVGDARSQTGLACWPCYLSAREAVRRVSGVEEVSVRPDDGIVVVRYRRHELRDRADLVAALKGAVPGVEIEGVEDPPQAWTRVRLTREVPRVVRERMRELRDARPLLVVKCVAPACERCAVPEPEWGDEVIRIDVDLDKTREAKVWFAPEAVPEWIAIDRKGEEAGRWRGRIDPADFHERLTQMIDMAR